MSDYAWWAQADLPPSAVAPRVARRLLEDLLVAWAQPRPDMLADDARVVVSELVTHAVVHAGDGGVLQLQLHADPHGSLYIAVRPCQDATIHVTSPANTASGNALVS